jgi:3-oxoacyl-[acyl-carrier protein] reductase
MIPDQMFAGRVALVTGGSRGIGRAVCLTLARHGARVAVNYVHNRDAADATLAQIRAEGGEGVTVMSDVASEDDVRRMAQSVQERLGPVDLLVNNAGMAASLPHTALTYSDWKRMFAVHVDGAFLTTWAVKDGMIARRYGRIVNISSIAGIVLKKEMIHYATAKAALISFTRHCAEAFAPHNVRVNCVAPGLTDTDIARAAAPAALAQIVAATPMGRMAAPEEIASVVKFMLSDDSSFVTGQTIVACGGRT